MRMTKRNEITEEEEITKGMTILWWVGLPLSFLL